MYIAEQSGRSNQSKIALVAKFCMSLGIATLMTGCNWGIAIVCGPSPDPILRGQECGLGGVGGVSWSQSSSFDASALSIDLSDSSVSVETASGWLSVTAQKTDGSLDSSNFEWQKIGSQLILSDPAAAQNLVQTLQGVEEISFSLDNIQGQGDVGTNTFATEIVYDGDVLAGDVSSWYSAGCDGIFSSPQLCG